MHNNPKVDIRSMKSENIDDVLFLWRKLAVDQMYRNEYRTSFDINDIATGQRIYFENCFKNPACEIFIVDYNNKIVGFSEIWMRKRDQMFELEDYAYIMHFFIDTKLIKDLNSLHLPLQLFKTCEKWSLDHNFKYLCSDVYGFNTNVHRLLEWVKSKPYKIRYSKKLI